MDERTCRILLDPALANSRATGNQALRAARKMRAGEICNSCKCPLRQLPGHKRCASKHHVHMMFLCSGGWHCHFTTERWQPPQKRVIFSNVAYIWETARRGDGLIDDAAREALELAIEIEKGGIMLRLTDEQYQARVFQAGAPCVD